MAADPASLTLPAEGVLETGAAGDVLVRTDAGILVHASPSLLPPGMTAGDRVVIVTGAYMAPLRKWRAGSLRSAGVAAEDPSARFVAYWREQLPREAALQARLDAVERASRRLDASLVMFEGAVLTDEDAARLVDTGRHALDDAIGHLADVAPTLTRLYVHGEAAARWKDRLDAGARAIHPEASGVDARLVRAVEKLRARAAASGGTVAAPASRTERERYHGCLPLNAPRRALLALTNGLDVLRGTVKMQGLLHFGDVVRDFRVAPRTSGPEDAVTTALLGAHAATFAVSFDDPSRPDGSLSYLVIPRTDGTLFVAQWVPVSAEEVRAARVDVLSHTDLAGFLQLLAEVDSPAALRAAFGTSVPYAPPVRALDGPAVGPPDARPVIEGAMRRLRAWMSVHAPVLVENLAPGATTAQLDALATALGFPLPEGLRQLWSIHDGQHHELDGFVRHMDLLGTRQAAGALDDVLRWVAELRAHPEDWAEARVDAAEIASDRWVPLAERGYADMLAVSGLTGRVFTIAKDIPPLQLLAPSVSAWLESYANDAERGAFTVARGFGQAHLSRKA